MTDNPGGFDAVSDSTDWLTTRLPGLAAVESALRCEVCKDFYRTPMLTSCNHTFCSLCIRRALSHDGKCPLCRANDQEMKLRSNWSMEEVVTAFAKTRTAVLGLARQPSAAPSASASPKRRFEADSSEEARETKRLRHSERLSAARGAETLAEMARQEAYLPEPETEPEPDDGLVACPICTQRMKEVHVYRHIDTSCPGSPQEQPKRSSRNSRSNTPNSFHAASRTRSSDTPERLAPLNYSMLKEPQLRRKMTELGISTAGSRQMMEKRHREWITIWNANCDSLHPRKKSELLRDLDTWERTVGTRAPTMSKSANMGNQIKDKDFDQVAWSSNYDDSFKDLIANARRTRSKAQQKAKEASEEADSLRSQTSNQGSNAATPEALPRNSMVTAPIGSAPSGSQTVATKTDVVDLTSPVTDQIPS